jgi:SAM-dependent methyltransferase
VASRVEFAEESAVGTSRGPADLVLCLGASHALSEAEPPEHTAAALRALRRLVTPGGRVLLAEGFWERPPADAELAAMWPGASAAELRDLPGLVDLAVEAGFRPSWIETASQQEWDDFESGYQSDVEEWLASHGDHPLAGRTREQADQHRARWLRGYRGVLGLAYLTLVPAA